MSARKKIGKCMCVYVNEREIERGDSDRERGRERQM